MKKNTVISPFKADSHAHGECLKSIMDAANALCAESGSRLTPLRKQVLELVWRNHEPVKAYDILDQLKREHSGSAPPTVYRALDFLQQQGLVHKIESLNAYVGCGSPAQSHHNSQFLICKQCGCVAELDDADIRALVEKKAAALGFSISSEMVEISGQCANCQQKQQQSG